MHHTEMIYSVGVLLLICRRVGFIFLKGRRRVISISEWT